MYKLDIAEVARRSGFAASALRYYEKRGLIASDGRHGLRRQYDDGVLIRLGLIALGQRAGYSLDEIATLLQAPAGEIHLGRADLQHQANKLRHQARQLQATAALLEHVAACTAPSHLECPRFHDLLQEGLLARTAVDDPQQDQRPPQGPATA